MWLRNLVFVGLVFAGAVSIGTMLFPEPVPVKRHTYDPADYLRDDFATPLQRLDAAFHTSWKTADVQPAPHADALTLVRRLSLGLMGRVPSLQEIRQLEAQPEEHRVGWWLEGIFADRRFADYVAERLARAYVGTEDGPFILFRRRRFVSWLSDELHKNTPYDVLVRQVIASEGLWTDQPATNFVTVTANQAKNNQPDPERLAGRVTRAFLGIRLDCAQCHNHPFESWKQADFQGLAGFFGQTHQGFTGIYDGTDGELTLENRKTGALETIAPRVPFLPELLSEEGSRREQLANWITHSRNTYFSRAVVNRVWALVCGRPLVEPVDEIAPDNVPETLDILAEDFATHGHDLRRLIRLIANSTVFRRASAAPHELTDIHDRVWAAFPLTRLRPEQVVGGVLQATSLTTIDAQSPLFVRILSAARQNEFVTRYGDTGEDEFNPQGGTIPQRLLLMNGELVHEKTKEDLFNAATRLAWLAPDDPAAVRNAYLAVLTREPTPEESTHFTARLAGQTGKDRIARLEDLYWTLINSSEFAWNH